MANIIRTDPFQELVRFDPFRGMEGVGWPPLRRFLRELPSLPAEPAIKLEVTEDDKAFKVKAELPGVKKDDIAVEVEGDQVSISAEVKRETEEKEGEKVVHSERYYGKQYRSFTLGREIAADKVEAKFADGVLDLTLPKASGNGGRKIAVQ